MKGDSAFYQKILVPLDGSKKAEEALGVARELAQPLGAELHLLVAITLGQVLFADREDRLPTDFEKLGTQQLRQARAYLGEMQERYPEVEIQVVQADPRQAIVEYANANHIDLIVMTSTGKSNWERWLSGSIADSILRNAPCPVLVVRDNLLAQVTPSE